VGADDAALAAALDLFVK